MRPNAYAAPMPPLVATIIHEWLHILNFKDPTNAGDPNSIVYGTEQLSQNLSVKVLKAAGTVPTQ